MSRLNGMWCGPCGAASPLEEYDRQSSTVNGYASVHAATNTVSNASCSFTAIALNKVPTVTRPMAP